MSSTEIIYGVNPVIECLRSGRRLCREVFIESGRREASIEEIKKLASAGKIKISQLSKEGFAALVTAQKNQGVAAAAGDYPYSGLDEITAFAASKGEKGFILVLDGVTDPQNLGALIRTANLMGVHGVIFPKDNSAVVTPAVVKASAGATEHQRIAQVTNIARTLGTLKEKGFWVIGAAGESAESIYSHNFSGISVALVLGSEGSGMRRLVRETCDYLVKIPINGQISSFNVSVAGAIIMGEIVRQRNFKLETRNSK